MIFFHNYNDTFNFTKEYINDKSNKKIHPLNSEYILFKEKNWPFEISLDALKITLDYLINKLHHVFYVACSDGYTTTLCKIEPNETSPFVKKIIQNEINSLHKNPIIKFHQREYIKKQLIEKNKNRILQCVVKKIKNDGKYSIEYDKLFSQFSIPKGVYILNLTDVVILHKEWLEPYPIYRQKKIKIESKYINQKFLPIFSTSGHVDYWDIPIPNYDDVDYILGNSKYDILNFNTNWETKINKAVFRGGPSGCGYTPKTNQRIKLATLKDKYLDVGIVSEKQTIDSNSIKFDPIYGLGMMNTNIKSVSKMNYMKQSEYKYIIHIDGNVNAYRLLSIMATGSLILRVKSPYLSWMDSILKPNVHYIEIDSSLSNLREKINWCIENDNICFNISQNALKISTYVLTNKKYIYGAIQKISNQFCNSSEHSSEHSSNKNITKTKSNLNSKIINESKKKSKSVSIIKNSIINKNSFHSNSYIEDKSKKCKKGFRRHKTIKNKCIKK